MNKQSIKTSMAPAAIGPYSQGVDAAGVRTVYVSGQLPIDPSTGVMAERIESQTLQSMKNVLAVVEAAGGTADNVVKCTLFITDMTAFAAINAQYEKFFGSVPPARAVVEVAALPKNAMIEIEAIAVL